MEEGLILKLNSEFDVDVYVDADFARLWPYKDKNDPVCVKSCAGYIITVAGCPIICNSWLMPETALSTMEAEYNALSLCMQAVLPFQQILKKILISVGITDEQKINIKTSVWEDNVGALTLAKLEPGQMTQRSNHYAVKYHWFRLHIKPNKIKVNKIDTKDQKADILTNGLRKNHFERIRKLLCGW